MRPRADLDLGEQAPAPWPRRRVPLGRRATIGAAVDQHMAEADRRAWALLRLGRTAEDVGRMMRLTPAEVLAAAERAQRAMGAP